MLEVDSSLSRGTGAKRAGYRCRLPRLEPSYQEEAQEQADSDEGSVSARHTDQHDERCRTVIWLSIVLGVSTSAMIFGDGGRRLSKDNIHR